jgi:hypothetical protein
VFLSLDFLYTPCADVDAAVEEHVALGAALRWRIRAMDTTVTCLRVAGEGPALLLADHLPAGPPILVYRVADYAATVADLRAAGALDLHEIEIPPGPCATFHTASGERLAVYELTRPELAERFDGRVDP